MEQQKIPLIPPLFHEDKFVADLKQNPNFFIHYSLIKNNNKLPSYLQYLTANLLSSISFSQDHIAKKIQNLDPNKAYGHDNFSICMLKICGSSIYQPKEMIFKQCIETGVFCSEWKKGNIVPIHENGDKQTLEIITQCCCYLFVEKIFKNDCLEECSNLLLKMNLFHQISPVLSRAILALISVVIYYS